MAYRIQTVNDVTSPDVPLGVNLTDKNSGMFQSVYSTNEQAKVNLKTLLLTRKGERYHQLTFGSNLLNIIFEHNVSALKEDIIDIIPEAVNEWIPYISIETIDIITNEDDPTLEHNIKVTIEFSINNFDEQKITIFANEDGTVLVG
jgi:phage baseplate assembly protein W